MVGKDHDVVKLVLIVGLTCGLFVLLRWVAGFTLETSLWATFMFALFGGAFIWGIPE